MSQIPDRSISGVEAADLYVTHEGELQRAELVRAEVVARLAISLSGTVSMSLQERVGAES